VSTTPPRMQLRQPRLAEMVAGVLRRRILNGELTDGALLPKQEELIEQFNVSKPSIREALRILETEGLITVQRGNVGGAVVHVPKADSAAYMLSVVLQSWRVTLEDVGAALKSMEPMCAALCAERTDQAYDVDELTFTQYARQFHEEIVARCGNQTMILVVGALESLWSGHEQEWAQSIKAAGQFPDARIGRNALRTHDKLLTLIEAGNAAGAARVARKHMEDSIFYAVSGDKGIKVSSSVVR
jgi:GntR family transcriptional repressor for pyruvate dehydrogenase complex